MRNKHRSIEKCHSLMKRCCYYSVVVIQNSYSNLEARECVTIYRNVQEENNKVQIEAQIHRGRNEERTQIHRIPMEESGIKASLSISNEPRCMLHLNCLSNSVSKGAFLDRTYDGLTAEQYQGLITIIHKRHDNT